MKLVASASIAICMGLAGVAVYAQSTPTKAVADAKALPDLEFGADWRDVRVKLRTVKSGKGLQARGWSDPAAGCYAAFFTMPAAKPAELSNAVASLSKTLRKGGYEVSVSSGAMAEGHVAFARQATETAPSVDGLATLRLSDSKPRAASVLACYWNEREPAHCRASCEQTLESFRVPGRDNAEPTPQ